MIDPKENLPTGQKLPATHAVTTPNAKPPTELEAFRKTLVGDYQKQVSNYFMGKKDEAMKFMSAVINSVQKTPELLKCDKASLMQSFMTCAEYQLYPSNASGEAYVLPYAGKAQFQLGYQGVITLLYRNGIDTINTNIVFENDVFEYEEGLTPKLVHKPTFKNRGEAIGVYAIAVVNGQKIFKVMGKEDVMKFKTFSKSGTSQYSPWNEKNDPELHMWRKTCIKQLAKVLPKNNVIAKALEKDNSEDSNLPTANLDAAGIATGKALHTTVVPVNELGQE